MIIGGIEPISLVDYPGKVASVIFTQGCTLRCSFCHNPSLVEPSLFTEPIPEEKVFAFLKKRRKFIDAVVIGGGEPTMQKELLSFLKKIKELSLLVKLDTSGIFPEVLSLAIDEDLINYAAMDIKAPLNKYQPNTPLENIKKSISILLSSSIDYEFRTTLVPNFHTMEDVTEMSNLIQGAKLYALQNFSPKKTLDPSLQNEKPLPFSFLKQAQQKASKFVECCIIRSFMLYT